MTIYELTGQYIELMKMLDEGATEEELRDSIEALDGDVEAKLDNCMRVVRNYESDAEAIKKEIERLEARYDACISNAVRVKSSVEHLMRCTGKTSIKTNYNTFTIQKNPASVEVIGNVPEKFYVEQDPKLDKKALKEFLKNNGDTEYARLVQTESLRVR